MSAKLNERLFRLAARVRDERSYESRYAIADAIESIAREVAQPIADERDELREALTDLHDTAIDARALVAGQNTPIDRKALIVLLTERLAAARAILSKYPPKQP